MHPTQANILGHLEVGVHAAQRVPRRIVVQHVPQNDVLDLVIHRATGLRDKRQGQCHSQGWAPVGANTFKKAPAEVSCATAGLSIASVPCKSTGGRPRQGPQVNHRFDL